MSIRVDSYLIVTDIAGNVILEQDGVQCVHCGKHYALKPGSKNVRGFCYRCNGPICGPGCKECVPNEQQLDNLEAGRDRLWTPISIYTTY